MLNLLNNLKFTDNKADYQTLIKKLKDNAITLAAKASLTLHTRILFRNTVNYTATSYLSLDIRSLIRERSNNSRALCPPRELKTKLMSARLYRS